MRVRANKEESRVKVGRTPNINFGCSPKVKVRRSLWPSLQSFALASPPSVVVPILVLGVNLIFISGLVSSAALAADAPTDSALPAGSTSQTSLTVKPKKPAYVPIDFDSWKKNQALIEAGQQTLLFSKTSPPSTGGSSSLNDEWQIAIAQGLIKNGQPHLGMLVLADIISRAVGTNQSRFARQILNETSMKEGVDEDLLEDLAYDLDTTVDDPEERSIISYFRGRALLRKGFPKWAAQATTILSEIPSAWSLEQSYDKSLDALEKGDSTAAYTQFENLRTNPLTRETTRQMVELALARLTFEHRDFQASVDAYKSIDLGVRDRAHALSEIAWSYYYDHQYGKALGAIRALKTAYFRPLLSPENILLEMLIYRDLCQYQLLRDASTEFQKKFQPIYSAILARKPFEKIPSIDQMVLQEGTNQKRATLVQAYRRESKAITDLKFGDLKLKRVTLLSSTKRQKRIDQILKKRIHSEIDTFANWFLDLREQVWFLDYDASIRLAQLRAGQDSDYLPPEKDSIKVSTVFWPVSQEAWIDELPDYEVLIQSSCRNPSPGGKR